MVKFDLIQLLNTFNFFKQVIDIYFTFLPINVCHFH